MKRRLKRLVPTYIIFIVVWLACQFVAGNFNWQMAIGNLLAVQDLTGLGSGFNWYISAIFLFYLLAPYFMVIVKQASPLRKIIFFAFLLVFSIPFWGAETYIITISRLPIFYMGMLFGDMCAKDRQISGKNIVGLIFAFILGAISLVLSFVLFPDHLWSHGLYWYPFIAITPTLCLGISYIFTLMEKVKVLKPIVSFFALCGDFSFELYLVHILLIACITEAIKIFDLSRFSYLVWPAGGVLLFIGCFILRRFTALVNRLFQKCRNKNK